MFAGRKDFQNAFSRRSAPIEYTQIFAEMICENLRVF